MMKCSCFRLLCILNRKISGLSASENVSPPLPPVVDINYIGEFIEGVLLLWVYIKKWSVTGT